MPDPINLRQARKAKARVVKDAAATQNRITFGQSKAATSLNKAKTALASRRLEGAHLERKQSYEPD
jgi:Domain of unknown function (DUF4169)